MWLEAGLIPVRVFLPPRRNSHACGLDISFGLMSVCGALTVSGETHCNLLNTFQKWWHALSGSYPLESVLFRKSGAVVKKTTN